MGSSSSPPGLKPKVYTAGRSLSLGGLSPGTWLVSFTALDTNETEDSRVKLGSTTILRLPIAVQPLNNFLVSVGLNFHNNKRKMSSVS